MLKSIASKETQFLTSNFFVLKGMPLLIISYSKYFSSSMKVKNKKLTDKILTSKNIILFSAWLHGLDMKWRDVYCILIVLYFIQLFLSIPVAIFVTSSLSSSSPCESHLTLFLATVFLFPASPSFLHLHRKLLEHFLYFLFPTFHSSLSLCCLTSCCLQTSSFLHLHRKPERTLNISFFLQNKFFLEENIKTSQNKLDDYFGICIFM